jgi:pimeloyl-ACP methyl ester carboxylesterase
MKTLREGAILLLLLACSPAPSAASVERLAGRWEGAIVRRDARLTVALEIAQGQEGLTATLDIPDWYVTRARIERVRCEGARVRLGQAVGAAPGTFDGVLRKGRIAGVYKGSFAEEEISARFTLHRKRRTPLPYREKPIRLANGGVTLAGSLIVPRGRGPHPALVLLHGSGPQTRDSYLRFFADFFARRGIAALLYDKRGTGASGGPAWAGDDFEALAADALAAVRWLRGRREIDPGRIGLWGVSQGGWIGALAASRSREIAFVINISGLGVTIGEQERYDDEARLREKGFSEEEIAEAISLLKAADDYARTGGRWDRVGAGLRRAKEKPWYPLLDRYPVKLLPRDAPGWRDWGAILDLDPCVYWEKVSVPVLALYGERDRVTPARVSALRVANALRRGGNADSTVRLFPRADHGLWIPPPADRPWGWRRPAPGWLDTMAAWVRRFVVPAIHGRSPHVRSSLRAGRAE